MLSLHTNQTLRAQKKKSDSVRPDWERSRQVGRSQWVDATLSPKFISSSLKN